MPAGLRLLDDLTREGGLGIGSSWLHLSSPPHKAVPPRPLVGCGGGGRKNVNGIFLDSHPSYERREKGGFRQGCVPAGKVDLCCVARPPGASACSCGSPWCHGMGAGSHAGLSWLRAGDSFQVGFGRRCGSADDLTLGIAQAAAQLWEILQAWGGRGPLCRPTSAGLLGQEQQVERF